MYGIFTGPALFFNLPLMFLSIILFSISTSFFSNLSKAAMGSLSVVHSVVSLCPRYISSVGCLDNTSMSETLSKVRNRATYNSPNFIDLILKERHQKSKSHYRNDGDGGESEVRLLGPDEGKGIPLGNIQTGDGGGFEVRVLGPDGGIGTPLDNVDVDAVPRIPVDGEFILDVKRSTTKLDNILDLEIASTKGEKWPKPSATIKTIENQTLCSIMIDSITI
ncbi:hypothetical protein V6N11_029621 [Hibiscus sabdariffa]|uniref:Uncharacterized protein n=1 Tax=Hibiscus sabdariffa TaxID=183260 RepID=A0ABR2P799_9ROSI